MSRRATAAALAPLFLVSLATVGFEKVPLEVGQLVLGRRSVARDIGISEQCARTALR